jgi:hypothetical protein
MQGATHLRFGDFRYERHYQVPSQTILSGFKRLLAGIFVNAGQNLLDAVALFPQVEPSILSPIMDKVKGENEDEALPIGHCAQNGSQSNSLWFLRKHFFVSVT